MGGHRPASCIWNVSFPTWRIAKHGCRFLELLTGDLRRIPPSSTRFGECSYLVFVYVHSFSAEQAPSFGEGPPQHTSAECILQGCEMLPYPGMPLGDMLDHYRMLQCQLIESPFVAVHLLGNVLSPERMHMLCGLLQIPEG